HTYRGNAGAVRGFMHEFGNEVLRVLTGKTGAFGTRIAFARRLGPGRKDVFVSDFDGYGVGRVSGGKGVNMLPTFGPGGVWYSKLTKTGMFITKAGMQGRPVIDGSGLNMGGSICNNRLYFQSSRERQGKC